MERYAASLCGALMRARTHHRFFPLKPTLPRFAERLGRYAKRFLAEQYHLGVAARRAAVDLMFYPAFPPGAMVSFPFAMVVYDTVPWHYRRTMAPLGRYYLAPLVRYAARRARAILTISHCVKSELDGTLGSGCPEIVYAGAGVDAAPRPATPAIREQTLRRFGLQAPFLLAVGSIEPRKNYPAMIRAMQPVFERTGAQLAIVGRWAWGADEVRCLVEAAGNSIRTLGYVSEADLAVLYDSAAAFLQSSVYEGLGLPVLEALAHGLPVVANDIAVFREIGAGRVHLVNFDDAEQAPQQVMWLLEHPEELARIRASAASLCEEFSWDAAASRCIDVFDRLESQGSVAARGRRAAA